jgi:hypothetical protein
MIDERETESLRPSFSFPRNVDQGVDRITERHVGGQLLLRVCFGIPLRAMRWLMVVVFFVSR